MIEYDNINMDFEINIQEKETIIIEEEEQYFFPSPPENIIIENKECTKYNKHFEYVFYKKQAAIKYMENKEDKILIQEDYENNKGTQGTKHFIVTSYNNLYDVIKQRMKNKDMNMNYYESFNTTNKINFGIDFDAKYSDSLLGFNDVSKIFKMRIKKLIEFVIMYFYILCDKNEIILNNKCDEIEPIILRSDNAKEYK